jgi:diguanylate cyclase (GGDEF)-like protein
MNVPTLTNAMHWQRMRLAAITNWAYGATVALTLASGMTMLLASNAYETERAAVEQRFALDKAASTFSSDIFLATDHARQYLNSGDPTYRILHGRDLIAMKTIESRMSRLRDAGASSQELDSLRQAVVWAGTLHDEQATALAAHASGDEQQARRILFGAEYERDLDRARTLIERFDDRLEQRTQAEVAATARLSQLWKSVSEIMLAITGFLFLAVLSFIFKRRVLRPVLRLSDVVGRLAAQDYAVELPAYGQIDEIGDMTQAIRVFRENGIERQRLEEERRSDIAIRDLLARMTQRMQGCDSLTDLKDVVRRFVPEITPTLAGRLYLLDDARKAVIEACNWLGPKHSRGEFPPLACWALRRGLPHRPDGDTIDVPCDHVDGGNLLAGTWCLPLTAQRETLGLLYFERRADGDGDAALPEVYLRMLAENIGLALANLKLRDALRDMAMADPLTGLSNRRRLDAVLELRVAEAEQSGKPLSCLMIDVDHFKRFNDEFGHDAGDAVLREVGQVLKSAIRDDGLAFRYGGEEFAIFLPGLGAEHATARAEEIRARIEGLRVIHEGRDLNQVSTSIGVASSPGHCAASRLVQTADAALLKAKSGGRNRVELAECRESQRAA